MTTFVLVHGAWDGPSTWDGVVGYLHKAGARTRTPDLLGDPSHGLHDHAAIVVAALDDLEAGDDLGAGDDLEAGDDVVLVGHSYAGLVVREAADQRPDLVDRLVLVDAWAGGDGVSLFSLAPGPFVDAMHRMAGAGDQIPAPPPQAFGITDERLAAELKPRLRPQPMRTFSESTLLTGAVDRIPGTAIFCQPKTYDFAGFGEAIGYRTIGLDGPHSVMLTDPEGLAALLLDQDLLGD